MNVQRSKKIFFRNPASVVSLVLLGFFLFAAIAAPLLAPYSPDQIFDTAFRLPPFGFTGFDSRFFLGTDDVGRDILSRLIYGARVSLGVGMLVVVLSTVFGVSFGLLAGYVGGWVDLVIMRVMDILMSLPSMLLAIVVVTLLGPTLTNAILAVAIVSLPGFVRIVRGTVLSEKQKAYVMSAASYGARDTRIAIGHVLPNCMAPILVQATLGFSDGILNAAALGFLGMGAQPPTPEWGVMLSDAKAYIESAWWLVTLPGICILLVVLCFNLLGDGLRDALDPKT